MGAMGAKVVGRRRRSSIYRARRVVVVVSSAPQPSGARETHRRLRRRLSSLVLREQKCADAYAYLRSCSFDAAPTSALWELGEAVVAEEREEYIEFVRAALTASWASSDAVLSYKVFMRFLDDVGAIRAAAAAGADAVQAERETLRELARLAFKSFKRRREAHMAAEVYASLLPLFGDDGLGSQLTLEVMRTIASGLCSEHIALLRDMLAASFGTSCDVPRTMSRDAHTVVMRACNETGEYVRTLELDNDFHESWPSSQRRASPSPASHSSSTTSTSSSSSSRAGVASSARTGYPSAAAVEFSVLAMEAAVRLRRHAHGMRHVRTLFGAHEAYMGSRHEHLVMHANVVQCALNLLAVSQTHEAAKLAETILTAAYANRKRVTALQCTLALKACRGSFPTASRLLKMMQRNKQPITPNHVSTLISTAGAAGDGAVAFHLFRDLLRSREERNVFTYNAAIAACGRNGMFDEVQMLLDGMREDGIAFDSCTYSSMLNAFVTAGRYDFYIDTVHEMHKAATTAADATTAAAAAAAADADADVASPSSAIGERARRAMTVDVLEESTWVELIKGCALYPTGAEPDVERLSRLQQLRRLDIIVRELEAAVGNRRSTGVADSRAGVRRVQEEDDVICTALVDMHSRSRRLQPLTGRLANVAVQTYCKLGDVKSAERLLESMTALGIRVSAKVVTALFLGLRSNGDLHSIVRLHSRIWGRGNEDGATVSSSAAATAAATATVTAALPPSLGPRVAFEPDLLLVTVVLFAAVSVEDIGKCNQLLRTMLSMKVRLNEAAYKPTLHACLITDNHRAARLVIKRIVKDTTLDWDQQMYFHVLSVLAMLSDASEAEAVIRHLYEKGLFEGTCRDSISSFHALALRACRNAGRGDLALHIFRGMQARLYRLDNIHYTLTTLALIEVGDPALIEQALLLHAEMDAAGNEPDTLSLNAAIATCSRAGLWREALSYLDQFDKPRTRKVGRNAAVGAEQGEDRGGSGAKDVSLPALEPDVASYTSAIHACGNAGEWRRAVQVFDAMIERGLTPDGVSFNCAIRACGMSSSQLNTSFDSDEARERASTIDILVSRLVDHVRGSGGRVDDQMSAHIIQAYGNLGFLDRALDWFHTRMDELGAARTGIVYTVMISACSMNRDWRRAVDVMKSMHLSEAEGVGPGSVTPDAIRAAFNAIRCSPTTTTAEDAASPPSSPQSSPSASVSSTASSTASAVEQRTLELVSWCEENGYADDFVYQMAMRVYRQTEGVHAMCGLVERVHGQCALLRTAKGAAEGVAVSPELLVAVVTACGNVDDLDAAMTSVRRFTSRTENPYSHSQCSCLRVFNAALMACERLGEAHVAKIVMQMMKDQGVEADHASFSAAIGSCGRDAATHHAYAMRLYEEMGSVADGDDDVAYKRLIEILWKARQVQAIVRLIDDVRRTAPTGQQPWVVTSVAGEGGTPALVAKVDLTEESADVACATLVYALATLHGDSDSSELRGRDIDGIEIWTGMQTSERTRTAGGSRSKHDSAMPATYYLLRDLGCPLPLIVIDTQRVSSATTEKSNVECVRTRQGKDFRSWWRTLDIGVIRGAMPSAAS